MVKSLKQYKFGLSSGRYKAKRKINRGRPVYRFIRPRVKGEHIKLQLKLRRKRKIRPYRAARNARNYEGDIPRFDFKRNGDSGLKFQFTKLKERTCSGYRLMNLDQLQIHLGNITLHVCQCPAAIELSCKGIVSVKILSEVGSYGLASTLLAKCEGCNVSFHIQTSPRLKTQSSNHFDVNVRGVWGCMVTGNGAAHLNEVFGTLDGPGLKRSTFSKIEEEIGDWWHDALQDEMLLAGAEEREIAIRNGNFHNGVPAITVITDGGWSKRSHKHSYNALGGVGIIIGKETGKLLHIGVRNKFCYICKRATDNQTEAPQHRCFKNWEGSSQSMESDVIVEGFKKAEEVHGLRYMTLIADGDSSVYANIQEQVPVWGKEVRKKECANHACKCLRSSLEKLVADNPFYKGKDKLSKSVRIRLVSSVRCAVRMRSSEQNKQKAAKLLEHDIRNSIFHIFGIHENCSTNFCKAKQNTGTSCTNVTSVSSQHNLDQDDEILGLFDSTVSYWKEGASIDEQEESRLGTTLFNGTLDKQIISDVSILLDRLACKSERLLGNITTNLAEAWMHMRAKFDGGKVLNLCNRGSWHARCYGAAARMNLGPKWSTSVWERSTGTSAGYFFKQMYEKREQDLLATTKCAKKPEQKVKRTKRKLQAASASQEKKARREYGPESVDVVKDLDAEKLEETKSTYLEKHINLPNQQLNIIQEQTLKQSQCQVWKTERKKRLTSSNFGKIIGRNPKIPVKNLVKNLLYSSFKGNIHTVRGLQEERVTIQEYILRKAEEQINVTVQPIGLIIDRKHKFLAASPDGKVIENNSTTGLLEVKNLIHNKPINLSEASQIDSKFCLEKKSGKLTLKRNHEYYFQCQGQLHITGLPWVDFVVRTLNPYQMHIERIFPDKKLWTDTMLPKLTSFYFKALLPEIAVPREGKYPGIREPGIWFSSDSKPKVIEKKPRVKRSRTSSKAETVKNQDNAPKQSNTDDSSQSTSLCRSRVRRQKFLGRRISHKWLTDQLEQKTKWYTGTVVDLVRGVDGDNNAVYNVLYDDDEDSYEVDHLVEDYRNASVKFIDL